MGIKLNRTKKPNTASGLDGSSPTQARQILSKKFIDSIGGYSSCDPHGTPMYAQSYSTPAMQKAPPAAWAEPQPEQSWSAQSENMGFAPPPESPWNAPQHDTGFKQSSWDAAADNTSFAPPSESSSAAPQHYKGSASQSDSSWAAPQNRTSSEPQSESSYAAPRHSPGSEPVVQETAPIRNAEPEPAAVTPSPWCGPSPCAKVKPQAVARVFQVEPQISQSEESKANREQKSERREWYECLATREFETAMALRCSAEAPLAEMIIPRMQDQPKSMFDQLADELVSCAQPALIEELLDQSAHPIITDIPTAGIARTERGTIEYIAHPTGTSIQPTYNNCGILMRISFNDGSHFERSNGPIPWVIVDAAGNVVKEIPISSVSIDSNGDVSFVTLDGRRTTMHANGTVSQKAA
jgi:hypothetical protein